MEEFGAELTALSQAANAAADCTESALCNAIEKKLENRRDGASLLLNVGSESTVVGAQVKGLVDFVRRAKAGGSDEDGAREGDSAAAVPPGAEASVDGDLMNEYEANHIVMGGAFPDLFPLGVPDRYRSGHLPLHVTRRLLRAYSNRFDGGPSAVPSSPCPVAFHS